MCLAIIYTNNKDFESDSLISVKKIDEYVENREIPSIVIGKSNAEAIFGKENVKVLNKEISKNVYWTYSKHEKRSEMEKDILLFNENIFKKLIKDTKYYVVDIYQLKYGECKNLIKLFNGNNIKFIYVTNKHIYCLVNKVVIGISLDELEYIGIKREKVINKIKENNRNFVFFNDFFIKNNIKKQINDNKIIIPYLYSIKNQ